MQKVFEKSMMPGVKVDIKRNLMYIHSEIQINLYYRIYFREKSKSLKNNS